MRIKCLILLAMLSLVFGSANAGLSDSPITDPSFESVENGADHSTLGGYGYTIDEWFENPDDAAVFWEKSAAIGLIGDADMWLGCETGGDVYQVIGKVDDEVTYTVKALIGNRDGFRFGTGSFSIYAGGTESTGADGIGVNSFATLIDSALVTVGDGTLVSTNVYEVEVQLLSGTGFAGQTLWLQVKSVVGKDYFDRVSITSSDMATDPVPADGADLVPADQVMRWEPPTAYPPDGYDVYFSTDPNLPETAKVIDGGDEIFYEPDSDLDFSTDYYWRVNPIDPNDGTPTAIRGSLWTFTTAPAEPTITAEPESTTIPLMGTAEFTVEDVGGTDYKWYRVNPDNPEPGDPEGDTLLVDSPSPILSIPNVQLGDEGYYYCIVYNGNGEVTSEQARLMIQRLVGHWKLDGDLTNEVTDGGDGTLTDPNFVAGIDGSALEFFGDARPVIITGSEEYYDFYPQGMTVSVWVNDTTLGDWDGLVSKQTECCGAGTGFTLEVNSSDSGEFTVRGVGTAYGGPTVSDGLWHLLTAVCDADADAVRLYRDGAMVSESTGVLSIAQGAPDSPLVLGAEDAFGQVAHTGLLDDVKIWNYPLDPITIADMYIAVFTDAEVCIENPAFDYNDNCMVDIDDFASIAAAWLECNMVPESECL